jgi:hypothetical protein
LREELHYQRNYGSRLSGAALDKHLRRLETIYDQLAPVNLVVRHRWLFSDGWPHLPIRSRDDDHLGEAKRIEDARSEAIDSIYQQNGFAEVERLAINCSHLGLIGPSLARVQISDRKLASWIIQVGEDFSDRAPLVPMLRGLLHALSADRSGIITNEILAQARQERWSGERIAAFLALNNEDRATWDTVAKFGPDAEKAYWAICRPNVWLRDNPNDFEFAIRRLLMVGRPRSAFQVCRLDLKAVDPLLLADMLDGIMRGEELDGPNLDYYRMREALDCLEGSEALGRDRLVRLGFQLVPVLGYEGERHAVSLYNALMSDPKPFCTVVGNLEPKMMAGLIQKSLFALSTRRDSSARKRTAQGFVIPSWDKSLLMRQSARTVLGRASL